MFFWQLIWCRLCLLYTQSRLIFFFTISICGSSCRAMHLVSFIRNDNNPWHGVAYRQSLLSLPLRVFLGCTRKINLSYQLCIGKGYILSLSISLSLLLSSARIQIHHTPHGKYEIAVSILVASKQKPINMIDRFFFVYSPSSRQLCLSFSDPSEMFV